MSLLSALLACPFCAEQVQSPYAPLLVLGFIAVPFAVAALVVRAIRNADH